MKQLLCLLALFTTWIPIPSPAADAPEPSPVPLVAFRAVHPDNDRLVAEGKPCPAGYTPYIYGFRNCQGQIEQEKLFLSNTPIVTESGVREAQVDLSMPHAINITLNTQASKTMKEATSAMKVGKDRIAIVVEGRVVNAPCVMAVISQSMIINSLHGEQDAAHLCDVLNRHAAEQKTSPSSPAA